MSTTKGIYLFSMLMLFFFPTVTFAQIEPDRTTSTRITRSSSGNRNTAQIDEGVRRGNNLFHSFEVFRVGRADSVTFSANEGVDLVISRVTGGDRSTILGSLEVLGNADLLFINPNGISFGDRAQLSLNGSFLATTASELLFDDGFLFSASNPKVVLETSSVNSPVRLGFRTPSSTITMAGRNFSDFQVELPPENTFSLIGGSIKVEDIRIPAAGFDVDLIGLESNSNINIRHSQGGFSFDIDTSEDFQNVTLSRVMIDSESLPFDVNLAGRNVRLSGVSISTSSASSNASSGNITITASKDLLVLPEFISEIDFLVRSILSTSGNDGEAGDIVFRAGRNLFISSSHLLANPFGDESGGNIRFDVDNNVRIISSNIDAGSLGSGNAGNVRIDARNLFLEDGSSLSSSASDAGDGGNITLSISDAIVLSGEGNLDGEGEEPSQPTRISTITQGNTDLAETGNAGNIKIITSELTLLDGASISAASTSEGDAGSISVVTRHDLTLENASSINSSTVAGEGNLTFSVRDLILLNGSELSTSASEDSDGGNITIDADNLVALDNSDIEANANNGSGGFIEITALGIFGTDIRDSTTPESDITAVSELDPALNGTVILNTPDLEPEDNLEELPEDVIDAETLVSASPCPEGVESEFVIEGSGGIPSSPGNTLSPEGLIPNDLTEPVEILERDSESSAPSDNLDSETIAQDLGVTPAWGWIWNDKGEILLTAHDPTVIASQRLPAHSGLCSGR